MIAIIASPIEFPIINKIIETDNTAAIIIILLFLTSIFNLNNITIANIKQIKRNNTTNSI
jgi:hypothetical protein